MKAPLTRAQEKAPRKRAPSPESGATKEAPLTA